ncbi:hypothetical protein [Cellulomonas alba]|uniref:DUF4352 domain-containing protein n=1 Tax=Cellulomonas alba TaxID=3053467 RepID=A0ABT7SHB7_9CELL|nr:hypothetical protein [Cellulomonas alba]MDM7855581.1 hypothetical protein [Cellulomonas alba]
MSASQTSAPAPRSRRAWWWAAAAAVVVAAVVLWLVLHGGASDAASGGGTPSASGSTSASAPAASTSPSSGPAATPGATQGPTPSPSKVAPSPEPSVSVPVPPIDNRKPTQAPAHASATSAGVTVRVTRFASVTTKGTGPGELSGPGVAVTIELRNDGSTTFDASAVTVSVYAGAAGTPLATVDSDPANAPVADVPKGATRSGTYVFRVTDPNAVFAVFVDLAPDAAPIVFQGLRLS